MADVNRSKRLKFITDYFWLWDLKMTRFFVENRAFKIPQKWRDVMVSWTTDDMSRLPFCDVDKVPVTLLEYLDISRKLSLSTIVPDCIKTNGIIVDKEIARGMSPKKLHEVSRLAGLVQCVCQDMQCQSVVDVGSGLGYLGTCLISQCGLGVTCVEGNEQRVESANIRERKLLQSHDSHMTTISLTLDGSGESRAAFTEMIHCLSVPQVCVVGLHCCGDLTPTLLSLLTTPTHPSLTSAVIVPCCYHKMATNDTTIHNFPLSKCLKDVWTNKGITPFNTYALRLAAQESLESWQCLSAEAHNEHTKRVAYRAVLEAILDRTGMELPGKAHRKANYDSFEDYFKSLCLPEDKFPLDDAMTHYNKYSPLFPLIEPFTALQYCMQKVLETTILIDRVEYLKENGLDAELVPVFDVKVSPRTFAIVAKRRIL